MDSAKEPVVSDKVHSKSKNAAANARSLRVAMTDNRPKVSKYISHAIVYHQLISNTDIFALEDVRHSRWLRDARLGHERDSQPILSGHDLTRS
jgi:hypothetical protein